MADGTLWWHKWPSFGLWADGGDCKGYPPRKIR